MPPIPFVGGSYTSVSSSLNSQKTVNFYIEVDETKQGKSPSALIRTPGLRLFCVAPVASGYNIRAGDGLYATRNDHKDKLFITAGNVFLEANEYGALVQRGSLRTAQGPVSIADNGRFLAIVDGVYGYTYDLQTELF